MRIRSDLKFGTITDNPLAIGAVTVNSAQFSTLPTVAGTDELYLTLDPEGSNREIVKVTAHAAAATSVTVQRGQLGTAAAQHALSTRWAHGIVTTDLTVPCTSSTRPTVGLWAGMRIYETDTNREYIYNGTDWVQRSGSPVWVTPTMENSWVSFGGAYQAPRYSKVGDIVTIQGHVKSGSLLTAAFTLPAGYRPAATLTFASIDGTGALGRVDITATGAVAPMTGNTAFFSLNYSFAV